MAESVQVTLKCGNQTMKVSIPQNSQIVTNSKLFENLKSGAVINLNKEEYAAFSQLLGYDKNKTDLTATDLQTFEKLNKAQQTEAINNALKRAGSSSRIGNVIMDETLEKLNEFMDTKEHDTVIITGGYPFQEVKHTNFMRIEEL